MKIITLSKLPKKQQNRSKHDPSTENNVTVNKAIKNRLTCYKLFKQPQCVDFYFQPIVKQIPSHVKDTTDILRKLDAIKSVPDNAYFVSLDVKSLHTSIQMENE